MPSKRAKKLWNSGIPLSRAWLEFAPPDLRSKFDDLPELLQSLAAISQAEIRNSFASALTRSAKDAQTKRQLEIELKEHLLTALFNRQIVATGYRIAPSRSQAPLLIDADKFDYANPDWCGATLEIEGIRYCRIRVTDPDICQHKASPRKGSLEAIDAAIDHLIVRNPDFCELKRKIACEEIRQFLSEDQIAGNGLSDVNLSKAIVRKCGKKRISKN